MCSSDLMSCLPPLSGAWRERGGGMFSFTVTIFMEALDYGAILPPPELASRARKVHLSQLGKALTDADMDPPINWMMVYNSNPVVTAANQNLVIKGLQREDLFTVVHEQFITDTALYADIVLPATTQFEHLELMPAWGTTYVSLNAPAIEPRGEALPNTEVFRRLSKRMGYSEEYLHISDEERIRRMLNSGHAFMEGITYERLEAEGWAQLNTSDYRPLANGGFTTPRGKAEFFSQARADDGFDPLPSWEPGEAADHGGGRPAPLQLVTSKTSHFLNSEYVNLRHPGTVKHEPRVDINPHDAAARDIDDGDLIRMFNRYGEVQVRANVSEVTGAGVVFMPFNWWPETTANGQSANALTPDGVSRRDIGSNAFDAKVEIQKIA